MWGVMRRIAGVICAVLFCVCLLVLVPFKLLLTMIGVDFLRRRYRGRQMTFWESCGDRHGEGGVVREAG